MKLNVLVLGYAGAVLSALTMLLLSIGANIGIYAVAAEQMAQWHMFYDTGVVGTITGMIEAAIISFVGLYVFGTIYNKLVK